MATGIIGLKQIIQSIDLCMTEHDEHKKKLTQLDLICEIDLHTDISNRQNWTEIVKRICTQYYNNNPMKIYAFIKQLSVTVA